MAEIRRVDSFFTKDSTRLESAKIRTRFDPNPCMTGSDTSVVLTLVASTSLLRGHLVPCAQSKRPRASRVDIKVERCVGSVLRCIRV